LINNNKKILPTLISRCINFKVFLTNKESLDIANQLLDGKLYNTINNDLIHYYLTPGNIYNLATFGKINKYNLNDFDLNKFLKILIKENHYKKNNLIKYMLFDLIEFYFRKINLSFSSLIHDKYSYFLRRISDTKKFNLDEESLFVEFEEEVLNG
jgi:DNA polymerase-3 subunit delta'